MQSVMDRIKEVVCDQVVKCLEAFKTDDLRWPLEVSSQWHVALSTLNKILVVCYKPLSVRL